MEAPFDIAADLDTPVSAFLKLKPLGARFLLESVERGEQVARFSFLGMSDGPALHFAPARATAGAAQRESIWQTHFDRVAGGPEVHAGVAPPG